MYWYGHDPQTEDSHPCIICGREIYGEGEICQRCLERMTDDEE